MTITRTEFTSGLRVVTERMPGVRSVTIGIWVLAGSRDERPADQRPLPLPRAPAVQGHREAQALDIAEAFDAVGGDVNAFTAKEYTCYYARVLDRDLEMAVDHLADMLPALDDRGDRPRGRVRRDLVRDRHARGLARGHGARRLHRGAVARTPARPPDPRHQGPDQRLDARVGPRLLPAPLRARADGGVGRRQRPARQAARDAGRPHGRGEARWVSAGPLGDDVAVDMHGRRSRRGDDAIKRKPIEQAHIVLGTNGLAPHRRRSLRVPHREHGARRWDVLAPVPGDPREAWAGLHRVQLPLAVHGGRRVQRVRGHDAGQRAARSSR